MSNKKFEFYPIYKDAMFKEIFGTEKNKKFTIDLLESYFNLKPGILKNIKIINSAVLDKDTIIARKYELDIKVKLPDGRLVNIEMQTIYNTIAEKKSFTYLTKLFSSQLEKNEDFRKIKSTISINFVKNLQIHKNKSGIQDFYMTNKQYNKDIMLKNLFKMTIIDVDCNCEYFKNSEFTKWIKFIRAENLKELKETISLSPLIKEAVERSLLFMNTEYVQDLALQEKFERWQKEEEERQKAKEERKRAKEDKKRAEEDKKRAEEDKRRAEEDKRRAEEKKRLFQEKSLLEREKESLKRKEKSLNEEKINLEEIIKKSTKESLEKEIHQNNINIAKNLLLNSDTNLETISLCTNLPICKLKKLKSELNIQEKKL